MKVISLRHEAALQEMRGRIKEIESVIIEMDEEQKGENVAAMQAFETRSLLVVSTMRPLMMCLRWCCCSSMV